MLRNPVVYHRANADSEEDIRKNLTERRYNLIPRIDHSVPDGQIRSCNVYSRAGIPDKVLNLILHMHMFDQRPSAYRNQQPCSHIDKSNPIPEDAHQKDKTPEIHHRRGDQE